jgi:hypothetical protein
MATQKQKIEKYEQLLHLLHVSRCISMDHERVVQLLDNVDRWSRACESDYPWGRGTEKGRQERIDEALNNLTRGKE